MELITVWPTTENGNFERNGSFISKEAMEKYVEEWKKKDDASHCVRCPAEVGLTEMSDVVGHLKEVSLTHGGLEMRLDINENTPKGKIVGEMIRHGADIGRMIFNVEPMMVNCKDSVGNDSMEITSFDIVPSPAFHQMHEKDTNMFEGAKFGEKYRRKDGSDVLYIGYKNGIHICASETNLEDFSYYEADGTYQEASKVFDNHNIIGKSRDKDVEDEAWKKAFEKYPLHTEKPMRIARRSAFVEGYMAAMGVKS